MNAKTELIKINPADYGLEESKATQISEMFKPMLDKMVDLEKEYNSVSSLEINEETVLLAKELRFKYVKVRRGTAEIHKKLKEFYLMGGKFVDGWKNAQIMASDGIEENLKKIEKHYELIEQEKLLKIHEDRKAQLLKLDMNNVPEKLHEMSDEIWENFIYSVGVRYEAKIEAEKKAEDDRITREAAEAEERKRIEEENKRLKQEAAEKDRLAEIEKEAEAKKEAERLKMEAAQGAEYEEEIQKEREEKEAVEAVLRGQKEVEAKKEIERLAAIETDLNKCDADKVKDLVNDLLILRSKYIFESSGNKKKMNGVKMLLDKSVELLNE